MANPESPHKSEYLIFNNTKEYIRFVTDNIVYISADANYSVFHTRDNSTRLVSIQLGVIEHFYIPEINSEENDFVRVGRSLIVNLRYLHSVTPSIGQIVLSDNQSFKYVLSAPNEILRDMKNYVELKWKK
ncbi:MAG: LytTR family transcriptional regulator [Bacteroidales bacterium]|nr:LytTR family transcriptional regulator [Bacteroidales bacterium]